MLLGLLCAGCSRPERDTFECHCEAVRLYPNEPETSSLKVAHFMKECMAARGYSFNYLKDPDARPMADFEGCTINNNYEDPSCYEWHWYEWRWP